jgi:hypothetical protein
LSKTIVHNFVMKIIDKNWSSMILYLRSIWVECGRRTWRKVEVHCPQQCCMQDSFKFPSARSRVSITVKTVGHHYLIFIDHP